MLQSPISQLAFFAGVVALVFAIAGRPRLAPFFDRLPAVVWIYFVPTLATTFGLLPAESPLYPGMIRYLLPASLILLLLSADLRSIARLGPTALIALGAACAGVAAGAIVAFAIFRRALPPESWKAVAALAATWTGGSANLLAVGGALRTPPALQGIAILVDTLVGYSWMGVLIFLAGRQAALDRLFRAKGAVLEGVRARVGSRATSLHLPLSTPAATRIVAVAIVGTAVALAAGERLPEIGSVLSRSAWGILIATTLGLALSATPIARLERDGASSVGMAGFYLLLAAVGAQADWRRLAASPLFVVVGIVIILVQAVVLAAALRLLRAPAFFFGAASQAAIGGYASSPIVAGIYAPGLEAVGLLLAVAGNVVGTYCGLGVGAILAAMTP